MVHERYEHLEQIIPSDQILAHKQVCPLLGKLRPKWFAFTVGTWYFK